jgi:hypothetical protein
VAAWARGLVALLAIVAVVLLVDFFYWRQSADLSIQSELNLRFAGRSSLASALERYPKLRPPLYPILLWLAEACGLAARRVNELLFLATLPLLYVLARRSLGNVRPLHPVLLYAVANFNYVNLHQPTAEGLFVLLSLVLVLGLADVSREDEGWIPTALVTVATAGLCLTRYFAVYFAVPLVAWNILERAPGPLPRRLVRLSAVLAAALLPLLLWMWVAHRETGFWTGVDRLAPRTFPEGASHWAELTGFRANLTLWLKTLVVDFFSPTEYAAHSVVTRPYWPSAIEWALVALSAWALVVAIAAWRRRGRERTRALEEGHERPLVAQAFLLYNAMTVATWTFANNDPIYTRFLYPSYVFLVLLGFYAYADVRRWTASPWGPLAFKVLYAALLVIHVLRNVEAVALPVRYGALYPVRFLI